MEKEIYLKLTEDEVETITMALHYQDERMSENCIKPVEPENADLITKIITQEGIICRPYVVVGVHDNDRIYIPKKIVVMATDVEDAIDTAKKKMKRTSEDAFTVKPEDVHEMTEDEFVVMEV